MSADPNDEERFGYPDLRVIQGHEHEFFQYWPLDEDGSRLDPQWMCVCGEAGYEVPRA